MNDDKKTKHWAKSLDDAGYLDDVDDGWTLREAENITKAKIVVEGKESKKEEPPKVKETHFTGKCRFILSCGGASLICFNLICSAGFLLTIIV